VIATLTDKQLEAKKLCMTQATFIMLFGGSRSGKTAFIIWLIIMRALKSPESRHCSLRFRFNHIKESIGLDTLPKILRLFFPDLKYTLNKTDWFVSFPNGSEYWLGGLDDAQRVEKILGKEFSTIHYNECSQIAWASVETAQTRLAQKCYIDVNGNRIPLQNRLLFDCNPPNNSHWTYQLFIKHLHPATKKPLEPSNYLSLLMNPADNLQNIDKGYIQMLEGMSGTNKQRFLYGQFTDANPNALWNYDTIEKWRVLDTDKPQMLRIVVAVDPSGADEDQSKNNDDIGIMVVGLGIDGNCYVLEDCTVNAPPKIWGSVATTAYDRHQADIIVAETNYGGGMVKQVIQASRPRTPFQAVTASRGKHVRAEPISVLYEQGKVRHVGYFQQLEDELCAFSTFGYTGSKSPNRADALVWAITALFPQATTKKEQTPVRHVPITNFFNK